MDEDVTDKMLLMVEGEFSPVLQVSKRQGNTLTAIIRQAWDSGSISTLTRNAPIRANDAHVSIIGHITCDELIRLLDSTDLANGMANRFLWICTRRSKLLPDGGNLDWAKMAPFVETLRSHVDFATYVQELKRDPKINEFWRSAYGRLSQSPGGLMGAVVGRSTAYVLRLMTIYALLDRSPDVRLPHLEAALALWNYAQDSVSYIFGDSLGDPVADTLVRALRNSPDGLTRTNIRDLFGRNLAGEKIDRSLDLFRRFGLAEFRSEPSSGRHVERWFPLGGKK